MKPDRFQGLEYCFIPANRLIIKGGKFIEDGLHIWTKVSLVWEIPDKFEAGGAWG